MELPPWEKRKDQQNIWADVKEGFRYLLEQSTAALYRRALLRDRDLRRSVQSICADLCDQRSARRRVRLWLAHVGAGSRRHRGGVGVSLGEQAPRRCSIHMCQLFGICCVDRLVCLFAQFLFVVSLPGDDWFLPNRRPRSFQHRDSNCDARQSAGTRAESILYGSRTVVAWAACSSAPRARRSAWIGPSRSAARFARSPRSR